MGWLPSFPSFYLFGGLTVLLHPLYFKDLNITALYVHKDVLLTELSKDALLRISRIQYGPDLFPYGFSNKEEITNHIFHISRQTAKRKHYTKYPLLKQFFEGKLRIPYQKVSSRHLRHMTVHEMRKLGFKYLEDNVSFLLPWLEHMLTTDMHEALFVGAIVWASCLTPRNKELMQVSGIWAVKYKDTQHFFNYIKNNFSLRLKAVQNLLPDNLTQFFELEVLVNRGLGEVNWADEKLHRTQPNLVNIAKGDIFTAARKLFLRARENGGRPKKTYWSHYWANRNQWAPTGAFHSQYEEDRKFRSKSNELRHKLFSLNSMPDYEMSHFINRKPATYAWPSTKYEWGKQRAIYGVDITNFVLSGFAMIGCEQVISSIFPIGPSATKDNVSKTVSQVLENGVPYCFDFEDFNSQHSFSSMEAVLEAYWQVYNSDFTDEQNQAMYWLIESISNCHIKQDDTWYKTAGTLLSGWRLTTFMNTILNSIYTEIGYGVSDMATTHNGDDVLAGVKKLSQVQRLQLGAKERNIRFQRSKCYLGAIAEFLRIDHKTGLGSQYLARGVATFVHGPTESTAPNDLHAVLAAITTRRRELMERDATREIVDKFTLMQLQHIGRIWKKDPSELAQICNTHVSQGGITDVINSHTLSRKVQRTILKRSEDSKISEDKMRELPGLHAYARQLTRTLIDPIYYDTIVTAGKKTVFSNALDVRFGVEVKTTLPDQMTYLNAEQYGMLRTEQPGVKILMAKAFNLPLIAINADHSDLAERLSGEVDPLAALRILT
uniref:RNA-directed RNA polymerase n=1 Tax=Phakopsora totivirus A TaxID=2592696 RepID=A0A7G3KH62_9VIRU|nr:putative RdRp [Phakopsora totivirus A]